MGRQSRVKAAHVKNIQETRERHKASVEDITATEDPYFVQNTAQNATNDHLEQGFFILEEDLGPNTDADIFTFSQILAKAQLAAVKAEQEATHECVRLDLVEYSSAFATANNYIRLNYLVEYS